jgi:hypothetical protein
MALFRAARSAACFQIIFANVAVRSIRRSVSSGSSKVSIVSTVATHPWLTRSTAMVNNFYVYGGSRLWTPF